MSTIFRVEKNQNFVVMSNHHLRNKELSLKSKGLLSLILSLPPEWNYSLSGLCAICKESQTAMRSALKELEQHRYLIRKRQKNSLGQFEYEYIVYEIPYTGNQHAGNQQTQKEHTENNRQINKEELNKDKLNIDDSIYIEQVLSEINDWELKELYEDYIEMRKDIQAPLTGNGLNLLIKRNKRITNEDIALQRALLEAAIVNQWKNVYLPNEQDVQNNNTMAERKRFYNL